MRWRHVTWRRFGGRHGSLGPGKRCGSRCVRRYRRSSVLIMNDSSRWHGRASTTSTLRQPGPQGGQCPCNRLLPMHCTRPPMAELPSGTVTLLLTDIEGSTTLWEQYPDAARGALIRHDRLIEELVG